ncbi:MAG: hypothetical protein MASP_00844 [Candidatus Methanolliviera sp. GoM_asphalt]|nr:MAG: hypothetical protein MASP_00844 [Candidatus Methanolliviera sp. GoM_asphalt]
MKLTFKEMELGKSEEEEEGEIVNIEDFEREYQEHMADFEWEVLKPKEAFDKKEKEEGIPAEVARVRLPEMELDEKYCKEEEYEYIPSDYPSHLSDESKTFFMFEEGKTPEDIERAGICDINEAKKYWEEYLYLTNEDNWDEIMEEAIRSFLEWVDVKSKVPSQEKMEGEK